MKDKSYVEYVMSAIAEELEANEKKADEMEIELLELNKLISEQIKVLNVLKNSSEN